MVFLKSYFGLFVVILLSVLSILPFFNSGFFPMHDDTQVARVFEMGKMLKEGVFPVRWVPDLGYGYGYPIFNFYAPLSYYIGGFFNVLGFDALISTKIMMVLGIILSGVFMYFLAREFFGETGGIISGLFYIYAPYHAVNIYVRGAVGEFYAYAFIPLMFLGFYKIYEISKLKSQNLFKWIIVGSIGYAGVILSHNLTAMMVTPFILIVILLNCYIAYRRKKYFIRNTLYFIFPVVLGILLSTSYWLPALTEMKYTNVMSQIGGGADFKDHFVCIQQLWNSQWGFGGSARGCIDGMSFKLGKLHILLSTFSLIMISSLSIKNKYFTQYNHRILAAAFSFLGLIVSVILMLEVSKPIWEAIPSMAFFQYPWRFLVLASFFSSFLAGATIWFIQNKIASLSKPARNDGKRVLLYVVSAGVIFSLIIFNTKLFKPQTIISKTVADYTSEYELKWRVSKISDEYLPKDFIKPSSYSQIKKNKIYFKDKPEQTFIQKTADLLSLAGIVVLIIGIIYTGKQKINEKKC